MRIEVHIYYIICISCHSRLSLDHWIERVAEAEASRARFKIQVERRLGSGNQVQVVLLLMERQRLLLLYSRLLGERTVLRLKRKLRSER